MTPVRQAVHYTAEFSPGTYARVRGFFVSQGESQGGASLKGNLREVSMLNRGNRDTRGKGVTRGNPRANGGKSLAGSSPNGTIACMATVMERTRKYLDTGEVAHLLERSRKWVRDRYDRGVFLGYRDPDDEIRKLTVESVRSYMLQHGIDVTELDEYLEAHP